MRGEPVSVLSTGSTVPIGLDYRGGDFGELLIVYNPATNSNNVFLALSRDATTAAVTGQTIVSPGQYAFFILTKEDNATGVNAIAATGTTVVTVFRQSFRSHSERLAIMGGVFGGAVAAQFWVAISGTQIALSGPFVEARADTVQAKTANSVFTLAKNGTGGAILGTSGLALDNAADTLIGTGTTGTEYSSTTHLGKISGNIRTRLANTEQQFVNAIAAVQYNGDGTDPRHTLTSTHRVLHTPVAGGAIASVFDAIERPIDDTVVIAGGDIVMISSTTGRLTPATTGNVTQPVLGIAATGGTGNTAGTVFARVNWFGWYYGLLADAAGVVGGQFVKPGTTTANRVESQSTPSLITFGRVLITRAATVATEIALRGMG